MKIYAGNLARSVTEDDLWWAFGDFGEVESVDIIKDKFSGPERSATRPGLMMIVRGVWLANVDGAPKGSVANARSVSREAPVRSG